MIDTTVQLDAEWRHAVDWTACVHEGHLAVVTVGGWPGRRRYWVRCFRCELRVGPWRSRDEAEHGRRIFDGLPA